MMLGCFAGNAWAQSDSPYVLKRQIQGTDHYLTHVKNGETWTLQDATSFNPETCLWYSGPTFNVSGTHHNYYFYDDVADKYHFLSAPLATNQDVGFSADMPTSAQLKNPDEPYYFYDWDWDTYGGGVARGHDDNGWWEVHWVAYSNYYQKWLTTDDSYHITDSSARFREVTVTPHDISFNWTQNNVGDLTNFSMDYNSDPMQTEHPLSITIGQYSYTCIPAYTTYAFEATNYNYQGTTFLGINQTPTPLGPVTGNTASSYEWVISGEGAAFLSFSSSSGSNDTTSNLAAPKLYYTNENTQGRKMAKLTLTMTFGSGETQATLVREATITVNTQCQNPGEAADPEVNFNDVTVFWYPTATQYKVEWKKTTEASDWSTARSAEVGNVTSYLITDLDKVEYQYRVIAYCGDSYLTPPTSPTGTFTPDDAPELLIYGSVFGGGRAANVTGKTEVVIVNCDSIGAIYGGNDIAGSAGGDDGSVITLGTNATANINIGSVYGGGNGYYAYGSTNFAPATNSTSTIPAGANVYALSPSGEWNDLVWTNAGTAGVAMPTITKTSITVDNAHVMVDSLFGGAKNAFVTNTTGDNTTININNGTLFAVFGGNNVGGTLGDATQKISVTNTTTDLNTTTGPVGLGRTHGIGYLFGGGNLVAGAETDITITGGQLDTIFGGGNRASVNSANLTINCTGDKRIHAALLDGGGIDPDYGWDGISVYNVHALFGGNNHANMNGVPDITLTSGGVGTAYGGGNAGDMLASIHQQLDDTWVDYSTHMVLEQNDMVVDYLYGGCQMSNVHYSTWTEIKGGHVGTVYGGCNVSGDVGSVRLHPDEPPFIGQENNQSSNPLYQEVQGATYVKITGGTVYRDIYAGSNGYYHCNNGVSYVDGMDFGDPDGYPAAYDPTGIYIGLSVPTHNETNVKVCGGHVKGNVYAGGNMTCVGFTDYTIPQDHLSGDGSYPQFVGMAFVQMTGGEVDGDVYGGGKMASVFGSNSVQVSGGTIHGALYGGNDRTGQVAQITNRWLPDSYGKASDNVTDLNALNVKSYVSVTGTPEVGTVYGGGNGDYIYDLNNPNHIQYCGLTPDEPIQSNTFVDIAIDGGANGGHIGTVYGGGNGVTVIGGITVFLNVQNPTYTADNVGTIFGGNNKGSLTLVPDIILLNGQVNTVYGGCNKGAMYGDYTVKSGTAPNQLTYQNVGSLVRLRKEYRPNGTGTPVTPNAIVSGSVYGGCRMNGVTNNSMVIVEGLGDKFVNAELFGGSDISGVVSGISQVVVNGESTTQVGNVYGGGNGHYDYVNSGNVHNVYIAGSEHTETNLVATDTVDIEAPYCATSRVDMLVGTCTTGHNLYAGGYAAKSGATVMQVEGGTVYDRVFGGGNLAGTTDDEGGDGSSIVNILGGTIGKGVYGGCNADGTMEGNIAVNINSNLGANGSPIEDGIFGGGYGNKTRTEGNVTVTIDKPSGNNTVAPTLYADIYGGSGFGDVNKDGNNTTTLDILDGTIHGNIYGGGLGDKASLGNGHNDYLAHVNGKVYVNIGKIVPPAKKGEDPTYAGNAIINGDIYGCNNVNGTPLDDVFVNIYKTNHGTTPQTNAYPTAPPSGYQNWNVEALAANAVNQTFALNAVYGGGNLAAYTPLAPEEGQALHSTTVHVYGCQENTIKTVYGGGNAADVGVDGGINANTNLIIDGGRINRMFGGGNGYSETGNHDKPYLDTNSNQCVTTNTGTPCPDYNPGANIYGTASSTVYAGLIDEVYGGANSLGNIDEIKLNISGSDGCSDKVFGKVFGCANEAPLNHSITTTIECGAGDIGELYGGSNLAPIGLQNNPTANVTLNLYGGNYQKVFAGSKGKLQDNNGPAVAADIWGDVTLNLFGGTVIDAFGGSDANGSISGRVTVNVLDIESETCPLVLTNVYGASNQTAYNSSQTEASPVVNLVHISDKTINNVNIPGIMGNVYGGGYEGAVKGHPQVNIGYNANAIIYGETTMSEFLSAHAPGWQVPSSPRAYVVGNVFGGGNKAAVEGTATVNLLHATSRAQNVFGGGNEAGTTNSIVNIYDGTVASGVYGGCNVQGTVTGDATVNVTGDNNRHTVIGTENSTANIYGGGLGQPTIVGHNVTVNFGEGINTQYDYPLLYGDIYGGSALGTVNSDNADVTTVNVLNGVMNSGGAVYGGGLGQKSGVNGANSDIEAHVKGKVHVNIGSMEIDGNDTLVYGLATLIGCDVYGANNLNGSPEDDVFVDVYQTAHIVADTVGNPTDPYAAPYAIDEVFGGGRQAHFTPSAYGKKAYVSIHECDNTVRRLFGGGDAADVNGVDLTIYGGRFNWVFGGGNGEVTASNILETGIHIHLGGGYINLLVNGSNENGTVTGGVTSTPFLGCGEAIIVDHFMGSNQTDIEGDVTEVIPCGTDFKFKNLYCGSNLAQIYGNINLTIAGGVFENVYGGSKGRLENTSTTPPTPAYPSNICDYTQAYLNAHPGLHPGDGGHITVLLTGGRIGNVYGGCDINGDVDGKITIIVDENDDNCHLSIGNIFGAGNHTDYSLSTKQEYSNVEFSPDIYISNGTIGGDIDTDDDGVIEDNEHYAGNVYGGGNMGKVTTRSTRVTVGDKTNASKEAKVLGNIYGGGNEADVEGNTNVVLQGNAEVGKDDDPNTGDVFGGGHAGKVTGSTNVTLGEP